LNGASVGKPSVFGSKQVPKNFRLAMAPDPWRMTSMRPKETGGSPDVTVTDCPSRVVGRLNVPTTVSPSKKRIVPPSSLSTMVISRRLVKHEKSKLRVPPASESSGSDESPSSLTIKRFPNPTLRSSSSPVDPTGELESKIIAVFTFVGSVAETLTPRGGVYWFVMTVPAANPSKSISNRP